MKRVSRLILLLSITIFLFSCNQEKEEPNKVNLDLEAGYVSIADTIINDILIKNTNNDEWTEYSLRKLDKSTLVNKIFELVYSGQLQPHEFFSDSLLSIKNIKELEEDPEFSRDKIAKAQFEESWYFDTEHQKMVKKVLSLMIAYEVYNLNGEVKGYKPAFKVYFK